MKKYFFAAIVLLFTLPAFATGNNKPTQKQDQGQAQGQLQGQAQGQGQGQAQKANAKSNATGVGVGVGIGKGGDGGNAKSYASGGDAYAKGGNASQGQGQSSKNVNLQGQDTDVDASSRNKNANSNSTYISDYEFEHNYSDDDVSTYVGGDTDLDYEYNSTEQDTTVSSDDDLTIEDNSSYTYTTPPVAMAGFSQNIINDCSRILGFDFRSAGNTKARGASFGLPWFEDRACRLDKEITRAFALGNYEMGWQLFCAQKANYRSIQTVKRAETGERLTEEAAIVYCLDTAREVTAPVADAVAIDTSNFATKEEITETVTRAFKQSLVK